MKSAIEKILSYKIKDGRVTTLTDKEQWTCLQKIVAINKLITEYHNAFIELKESYDDLLDRYNVINNEWTKLKSDMEAIADEWTEFKPLVTNIINMWENTISPTFEEWQTLMENWSTTMSSYSTLMNDYQEQMYDIQQQFNEIETEWGKITLAVKGEYTDEVIELTGTFVKEFNIDEYNDIIVMSASGAPTASLALGTNFVTNDETLNVTKYNSIRIKYDGNQGVNQLINWHSTKANGTFWADPTEKQIAFMFKTTTDNDSVIIFKRKIPYFSADQSSQVEEALNKANDALTSTGILENDMFNNYVSYSFKTQHSDDQMIQARTNIGAAGSDVAHVTSEEITSLNSYRTLSYDSRKYKFVYVEVLPNTSSAYLATIVPLFTLPTGVKRFQITDETNYVSFNMGVEPDTSSGTTFNKFSIAMVTRSQTAGKITNVILLGS